MESGVGLEARVIVKSTYATNILHSRKEFDKRFPHFSLTILYQETGKLTNGHSKRRWEFLVGKKLKPKTALAHRSLRLGLGGYPNLSETSKTLGSNWYLDTHC